MKQDLRKKRQFLLFGILILISIVLITHYTEGTPGLNTINDAQRTLFPLNRKASESTRQLFSEVFPPSTPLICPQHSQSGASPLFVQKQDNQLLYGQHSLKLSGFTFYPSVSGGTAAWHKPDFTTFIDHILDLGSQNGQNLVRPTDFWGLDAQVDEQGNATLWNNMDHLVCAAEQRHMFVEMDISAFSWFLISQGKNAYDANNWGHFLEAIGKHYSTQPAIAFYSILGEAPPPQTVPAMNALVDFYKTVTDELYADDSHHHLIMAGGFNHMEDETAERPWWQKIYALPHNDLVGFKTYSREDLDLIPTIAAYAKQLNEPLIDEEFGMPQEQGDATATGDTYNNLQISRAQFFSDVYNTGSSYGVTGFLFWNLGCQMANTSFDVNPETPAVWSIVQQYAVGPIADVPSQGCALLK